ncbi:PREDICTED: cationic amino acid transporter 4-like [Ceratotherium simum simum]|uniref:Cationic amino acid transporter 4-like n=1 Tax=Ceratotherium simum simum TaxID=73337 RepID=A0ABM0I9Q2_CERSS|nr:PREDICTED: cationic amino acid transporter 4-like [Ceratotherium simum simum]
MAQGLPSTASLVHFCQKLNRLKTLEESTRETLPRHHLTTMHLTLLGVGAMVGVGLYVFTGIVVKEMAGPAVLVSYSLAAVASLLAALCYAELGARVSHRDSPYLLTYLSMGELWAFLIGWIMLLRGLIGGAAMAQVWSSYLDTIFSHRIRSFTEAHVGIWQVPLLAQYPDFLAAGIILLASIFVFCGACISSWINLTVFAINLVIVLFIIILGFVLARPHNWSTEEGGFAPFGFSGIMAGAAICFNTFIGFDVIVAFSKEAQNPKRAVPKAIVISLGLVAGIYILVSSVLTLMVPWYSLEPFWALTDAFHQRGYSWASFIVAAGSICAMITVLLRILIFLPRMLHAMAVDGLIFQVFAHVHTRTQVPVVGILVFGVLMAFLALLLDPEALLQFHSISALLVYTFMATSIIVLRFQKSPPSTSSGLVSPGPVAREYNDSSGHTELLGTEPASAPEPGQLRPALRPYLGFLGGCRPGAVITWALGILVASTITLNCVLVFGDSALHLPLWGYILLLLLSSVMFLLSLLVLGAHHQQRQQDTFQVPLMPLTPALSILFNIFLMLTLSSPAWMCFSIGLLIGFVVYFGYGIRHSKENQRERPGLTATRSSLEETVQALQPPSQTPAQEPRHTEQPAGP